MLSLPKVGVMDAVIDWSNLSKQYMNPGELEKLISLMRVHSPRTVMEIGINSGRTAKALLTYVPSIQKYIGVDVNKGYQFSKEVQSAEVPEVPGEVALAFPQLELRVSDNGSFDINMKDDLPELDAVFIDGDHSYDAVFHDTVLARENVRKGGIIIWHDYHDLGTVDVRDFLHDQVKEGRKIVHIDGTWLAYEIME